MTTTTVTLTTPRRRVFIDDRVVVPGEPVEIDTNQLEQLRADFPDLTFELANELDDDTSRTPPATRSPTGAAQNDKKEEV